MRKGEVSAEMFALADWTDNRARTLHRCHINNWLFRTFDIEKSLVAKTVVCLSRATLVLATCAGMG
jgi:hypothetical protein